MVEPKVRCPWCAYNRFRCADEDEKVCDFKSLPMEKEAIVRRLKMEMEGIADMRKELVRGTVDDDAKQLMFREASDRAEGIQIMTGVLEEKFGVSKKQLLKELDVHDLSFTEKVRLSVKLATLKAVRKPK